MLGARGVSAGKSGELDTGVDIELAEDMAQVAVDSVRRNEEALGDLAIAQPVRDQARDRELRVGHSLPASFWTLRRNQSAAHTQCPEVAANPSGIPPGACLRIEQ